MFLLASKLIFLFASLPHIDGWRKGASVTEKLSSSSMEWSQTYNQLWPSLHMFLDDEPPPDAILIEYIPDLHQIDLSNFSYDRIKRLRQIIDDIHQAEVLHHDPYPRNMCLWKPRQSTLDWLWLCSDILRGDTDLRAPEVMVWNGGWAGGLFFRFFGMLQYLNTILRNCDWLVSSPKTTKKGS